MIRFKVPLALLQMTLKENEKTVERRSILCCVDCRIFPNV